MAFLTRISLIFFIARRYMFTAGGQGYLSLISWFSLVGMTLGVAALIVVTSVMNGFELQLRERILNVIPHILITPNGADSKALRQTALREQAVEAAVPYEQTQVMLSADGKVAGAMLNGIDPHTLGAVSVIPDSIILGDLNLPAGEFQIVIGSGLARQLGSFIGDSVTLVLPRITRTPAGVFPRTRRFVVSGVFEVGADVDQTQIYININDFIRLNRLSENDLGLRLKVTDVTAATQVAAVLRQVLPPDVKVSDWSVSHGSLFQAVKMEKLMVALLLFVVVMIAAFNIVAVLTMMVANKRSAIAVLQTIGASRRFILLTFVMQGAILGVTGTMLGALIGIPLAANIGAVMGFFENLLGATMFDQNLFYIVRLPSDLRIAHVVYVVLMGLVVSLLATLYPAWKASNVQPSEVLRYE